MGDEIQNHGEAGRPCVIVQNDAGNKVMTTLIVVPLRDGDAWKGYKQQVLIPAAELPFDGGKDSVAQCGQPRTVDRMRINGDVLCRLPNHRMNEVDAALRASLQL